MHLSPTPARAGGVIIYAALLLILLCGGFAYPARADTFVVTNPADPGDGTCTAADISDGCTLREAITAANASTGADTIDATGVRGHIVLTAALPDLSSDITIVGPGAIALNVTRGGSERFRVFTILSGMTVNISGITISGGWPADGLDGSSFGGIGASGGGIHNSGSLNLTRCLVSGNYSGNGGDGGHGNGGDGGGIYNAGTLTIIDCTVSGNQTGNGGAGRPGGGGGLPGGTGGHGGGIHNRGTAAIINSTVNGNRTGNGGPAGFSGSNIPGLGGGIYNYSGQMTISNSTISGNETGTMYAESYPAVYISGGGGLYSSGGQTTVSNSTITANTATVFGGGIHRSGGTVTLRSTIVANNSADDPATSDIQGAVQSDGYNLISNKGRADISQNPGAGPDFYGSPELDPLADNGGPTRTHRPRTNSPAIDKGKNFSASTTDQRGFGFARLVDLPDSTYPNAADATDIGAVELDGTFQFTAAAQTVSEGGGSVIVTVSRNGSSGRAVSVSYGMSDRSATLGADYTPAGGGTLHWGAGDTADKSFAVLITNDSVSEGDEFFLVSLHSPVGGLVVGMPASQTVTIQDDEAMPSPTPIATPTPTATPTATVTPAPTPTPTPSGTPVLARNISTRARIETGDNVMIAGFIVSGTLPKKVVLRGLGPSLQEMDVVGFVADPVLELRGSDGTLILGNDNWQDNSAQAAQIEAAGLAPTRSQESAMLVTLVPGTYTTIVRGRNDTTGVGLVEVYDIDNSESQLANISTRGVVQLQENVMIGGFTLAGAGNSAGIVVRALGPSLTNFGLSNVLQDPTVELRDTNGTQIDFNDNWQDDSVKAAQISAKGLAPTNVNESAISLTLGPGQYTAIVRGKNNETGLGLVEIYNTQ